jgi:hypothetical protein
VDGRKLRAAYQQEFRKLDLVSGWAAKQAPPKRTKKSSIASGRRVESGEALMRDEAYRAVDVFTLLLWYHKKNEHAFYDNAHQFANIIKQLMKGIKNRNASDKLDFCPEIRKGELQQGSYACV